MLHLITGGSASGKSRFGEQAALDTGAGCRYYIATMEPWGREGRERVSRHRRQREGKGFHTIEAYHNLETVFLESGNREDRVILLECMSNLVANEQFGTGGSDEEILGRIFGGVRHLQDQGKDLIIITNEVFSDGSLYERETLRYLKLLGQANRKLALWADQVTEVIYGIGVGIKGKEEDYGKQ
ncbi:MAG: bifunctional adenosylcobinamide kinase/adenosylcobinamide-phosphate guanylyltransferase [Lachnospiraceae bacterium]|jgi:adenosylcobinamide kinase/adenosylcobinamide-phosphate guanylyltransferase|nr:bifunctional adenosylcobinamide kinase/adenosylcobinamide-phosphate guanylyltransferase [Lachnospiraceae bacterium]